jgi:glycine hydroxymethyltransferase
MEQGLSYIDQHMAFLLEQESERQHNEINLIASENYVSPAVLEAMASSPTNKYAEGHVGKRYYSGCQWIDAIELTALDRLKNLFTAESANVQAHSGSQANMAAYMAFLKPGDTIMGMRLSSGGHLTHGHTVNFSGQLYHTIQYDVDPITERLNYDEIARLASLHKPKVIIAGASSYSRVIDFPRLFEISQEFGSYLIADIAHIAGLVASGLHPSPVPYADCVTGTTHKTLRGPRGGFILSRNIHQERIDRAIMPGIQGGPFMNIIAAKAVAFKLALEPHFIDYQKQVISNAKTMAHEFINLGYRIVSGGTDNHLFVVDLSPLHITGRSAEQTLQKAGINVSRSCIPFDKAQPNVTSGIRIGTPAITTRGFGTEQAKEVVGLIHDALQACNNERLLASIKGESKKLCSEFPLLLSPLFRYNKMCIKTESIL